MKVAAVLAELPARRVAGADTGVESVVVHTGQHYDAAMSDVFFRDFGMPEPDDFLNAGFDTRERHPAKVMAAFEDVCDARGPDGVEVVGTPRATLRRSTERLVTVALGTNELVPRTGEAIAETVERTLGGLRTQGYALPLWDGRAVERIVDASCEPWWTDEARSRRA